MSTIKDVERDLTLELLAERLRENEHLARSALQMVAVLVNKMGGEVEIRESDVLAAMAFSLAQIRREDGVMVLRVERRRPN